MSWRRRTLAIGVALVVAIGATAAALAGAGTHQAAGKQKASNSTRPALTGAHSATAAAPDPTKKPNVAYEPFCYSAGKPPTNSTGNDYGFAGTGWAGAGAVVSPGLTWLSVLNPSPQCNALGPTGGIGTRQLNTAVTHDPGGVLILRALFRSDLDGTKASQATLGNSGGGTFTIGDLAQSDPKAGNWGMQTAGGQCYSNVAVKASPARVLLVGQIEFGSSNDTASLWVQTSPSNTLPSTPDCTITGPIISKFSGVYWQTQQKQIVDEIGVDYTPPAGKICILKFNDKNSNGVQDPGEANLSGWTFTVKDANGNVVGTLTSGADTVCLTLKPGPYTITETQQAGWVATAPSSGTQSVTVKAGDTTVIKFGNHQIVPGQICVLKFWDKNGNGRQDRGEPILPGWVFTVSTSPVITIKSRVKPVCVSVPPGTYIVSETVLPGWTATAPPSGTQSVTVAEGQTVLVRFGNTKGGSLDHFKCYVPRQSISAKVSGPVILQDEFDGRRVEQVKVGTLYRFCNPVQKVFRGRVTPIRNPLLHLTFYSIFTQQRPLRVVGLTNQFGRQQIVVGPPKWLAVPTSKNSKSPPDTRRLNHFKCYPVLKGRPVNVIVNLKDQWHVEPEVRVGQPVIYCNPTLKIHAKKKFPIVNKGAHLVCYKLSARPFVTNAFILNQFNQTNLTVVIADLLCVPSTLTVTQVPSCTTGTKPNVNNYTAGVVDNFSTSNGPEKAQEPLVRPAPISQSFFDQTAHNLGFWHEFVPKLFPQWRVLCRVMLQIHVKPLLSTSGGPCIQSGNDAITLYSGDTTAPPRRSWQQYFSKGRPSCLNPVAPGAALLNGFWEKPNPGAVFTWNWNALGGCCGSPLPTGDLGGSTLDKNGKDLFSRFSALRSLVVYVEDDTSVDYIKLAVYWK